MPGSAIVWVRQCRMKEMVSSVMEKRIVHISRWFKYCLVFVISGASTFMPLLCQSVEPVAIPVEMGNKEMTYDINTITLHKERGADEEWSGIETLPDGIASKNISLLSLVQSAYGITAPGSVLALPKWASSVRFDVEFRMAPPVAEAFENFSEDQQVAQRQYMLQLILLDRFNLVVHHITKEGVIFELTVAGKLKLKSTDLTTPIGGATGTSLGIPGPEDVICRGQSAAQGTLISEYAKRLSMRTGALIVDKTGLTGRYDLVLRGEPNKQETMTPEPEMQPSPCGIKASLVEALHEQLGLNLTPTMGAVDTLVVDHVQMPAVDYPWPDIQ